jgi:hypothetical protein
LCERLTKSFASHNRGSQLKLGFASKHLALRLEILESNAQAGEPYLNPQLGQVLDEGLSDN